MVCVCNTNTKITMYIFYTVNKYILYFLHLYYKIIIIIIIIVMLLLLSCIIILLFIICACISRVVNFIPL